MRRSIVLGAVIAVGLSAAGHAATITDLGEGVLSPNGYSLMATFDGGSFQAENFGDTAPYGGFVYSAGALTMTFSGTGVVMNNGGQPAGGLYATPYDDGSNYMAVLGGGHEDIAFSALMNSFGLYWGSIDTYNSLEFYNGANLVATVSGADVQPPLANNGDQTSYATNRYIEISALPGFTSVRLASSSNSFEFDNVVAGVAITQFSSAVPEPSTWAMLMLGFGGLGYAAMRRRQKGPISALA